MIILACILLLLLHIGGIFLKKMMVLVFVVASIFSSTSVFAGNYNYIRHSSYDFDTLLDSLWFTTSDAPFCNVSISPDLNNTTGSTFEINLRRKNAIKFISTKDTKNLQATVRNTVTLEGPEDGEYGFRLLPGDENRRYKGKISFNCTW